MRRLAIFVLTALILQSLLSSAYAQTIDTVWTQNYWNGYFDSVNCVQQTSDSGFILVGMTSNQGEVYDYVNLIKTDSLGNEEWTEVIGDTSYQCGFHVLETYDGGYLISANSYMFFDGGATWIIKTDSMGDTLWTYAFHPEDRGSFPLYAVQTVDSGFAITGVLNLAGYFNQAFILKLDKDGNYVDYAHYGDGSYQSGNFITQMPDSGFIVAGNFDDYYGTGYDFWAFRTDKFLNISWDSTYAITSSFDGVYGGCRLDDGIVMVGVSAGISHAMKVGFDGNTVWSKSVSITPYSEKATTACTTEDGGVMVGGWVNVPYHRRDHCFIKLDSAGDTVWTYKVGGTDDDHARYVIPTYDGGYAMAGSSSSFVNGGSTYLTKIMEFFNTSPGTNVEVSVSDSLTLIFDNVISEGETEVAIETTGPALPGDFQTVPVDPSTYYNITTSATYDGNIEICILYDPSDVIGLESDLTLMHYNGINWDDITSDIDTATNTICGISTTLSPFAIAEPSGSVGIDDGDLLPYKYILNQNYPNPFNPVTEISFGLASANHVKLEVFNIEGRIVETILDEFLKAGEYNIEWDGGDYASGVYFYRLISGDFVDIKKMTLVK